MVTIAVDAASSFIRDLGSPCTAISLRDGSIIAGSRKAHNLLASLNWERGLEGIR